MGEAMERALAAVAALSARLTPAERAAMGCGDRTFDEMPPRFRVPTLDDSEDHNEDE